MHNNILIMWLTFHNVFVYRWQHLYSLDFPPVCHKDASITSFVSPEYNRYCNILSLGNHSTTSDGSLDLIVKLPIIEDNMDVPKSIFIMMQSLFDFLPFHILLIFEHKSRKSTGPLQLRIGSLYWFRFLVAYTLWNREESAIQLLNCSFKKMLLKKMIAYKRLIYNSLFMTVFNQSNCQRNIITIYNE